LLGDLAQISAVSGQSLADFGKMFPAINMDQFAKILGTDQAGLGKEFTQQEAMARAALDTAGNTKYTNELLADILAANQGHPLPFSAEQLAEDATGTITPATATGAGKSGAVGYKPPGTGGAQPASIATVTTSPDVTGAVSKNTDAMSRRLDRVIDVLVNTREDIKALVMHNRNVRP
jgi:hypothetical protein